MQPEQSNCVRKAGSVRPDLMKAHFRASLNTIPSTDASATVRRFECKHPKIRKQASLQVINTPGKN